jgi:hypothetical protein
MQNPMRRERKMEWSWVGGLRGWRWAVNRGEVKDGKIPEKEEEENGKRRSEKGEAPE